MSEPAPRIAIKFVTPSSSSRPTNGTKNHTHPQLPSTLGKRQRPQALNHDSDSDSGTDNEAGGRHEVITTIGGVVSGPEPKRRNVKLSEKPRRAKAPHVITGHKNRDWKAELKAQKATQDSIPRQYEAQPNGATETGQAEADKQVKWGLTLTKTSVQGDTENSDETSPREQIPTAVSSKTTAKDDNSEDSKGEDDDAINVLLGRKRKFAKDLIIEGTSARDIPTASSEQDMYRRRMEEAAEISTIEEYDQIPEGEFGAAMLRGMGWNGKERGSRPKEVSRRPHLMGLGSKEDEEIRKAELAQKHGHRERRPRLDEYRREKEKERRDREDRRGNSYKYERERERRDHNHQSHHERDRDRNDHRRSERSYRR
ncbi:DExH-box splicing factor binding site-domain-containing protein [Hypoxylon sp. NC1633]|nr:DExH-box splicing factor binding site-domain-containing protein [Hypoxylon sp. NC1633]